MLSNRSPIAYSEKNGSYWSCTNPQQQRLLPYGIFFISVSYMSIRRKPLACNWKLLVFSDKATVLFTHFNQQEITLKKKINERFIPIGLMVG